MRNLFILIFCTASIVSRSQSTPQVIIDEFFNRYKTKGVNEAIDYLTTTNAWLVDAASKEKSEALKAKIASTVKTWGEYHGYERVAKKTIGEHVVLHSFFLLYDRQPLRLNLIFYKVKENWGTYNFSFDDDFIDELKQATKAYRLKENSDN